VRLGKTAEADKLVTEALRIDPAEPGAPRRAGAAADAQGRFEEAAKILGAAARTGDADSRIELALLTSAWLTTGVRAKPWEGVGRQPGPSLPLAVMGQTLVLQGRRGGGVSLLRRAEAARLRRPRPGSASRKALRGGQGRGIGRPAAATPPNRFEQASVRTPTGMRVRRRL
jgi:hypothetical protein